MKSLPILLVLAAFGAGACGDDDGDKGTPENDAGTATKVDAASAQADATAAARPQQIDTDKVGAACTTATAQADCTGVGATCLTASMLGDYPAGYCSATCETSAECGPNGGCPIADLLSGFGGLGSLGALGGLVGGASSCYKKCTTQSECRTGYACASITSALSGLGGAGAMGGAAGGFDISGILGPSAKVTYCMPPVMIPDGGLPSGFPTRDGGTVTVIRGMDAGR